MKILVFSDNHGSLTELDNVLNHYKFDRIFGLGDHEVNRYELDDRNVSPVKGNSPFDDQDFLTDRICEIEDFKFLFTHGHTHQVRYSLLSLSLFAIKNECDIIFYGHTHIAKIDEDNGRYYINPGSIYLPYSPSYPTVAILDLNKNILNIKIVDAITFDVYKEITIKK